MISSERLFHLIKKTGILILLPAMFIFNSCENDLSKLPGNSDLKDLDADRASEVTFIYSENGKTKAKLYTKEFVGNENAKPPYIDFKKGVRMELFDENLKIENIVTAKTARYYNKDGNVIAKDSVVARNAKGEKLQSEELIWNRKLEKFYTEKFVRITTKDQIVWGEGLEANQDFSHVIIKNQRGSIPVNSSDLPLE
ncbi:LPS export ABC transporter periplasmic protein LptC [Taibaiella lutea]|uniref:LPS export ABC transporter periplasmic protein LptC n=1 Tax=Taibaiella lutea TaxID=2608001 RepID=A0A5M6CNL5_9BACT|nr:LPS export ABC transporter periplasmic protein LptC [Taibaiella lutea]KAA5534739.1 LPS export ABC transporter periplasmic protein LptC [Taibaiella lutea]